MYKYLLCWRYLRTRYIALASIVSVTLGVATMIVVNSVMSGFTSEMQNRIHGILSDVTFEARSHDGMYDAQWHMDQIAAVAGDSIEAMTPTVTVPAMLNYRMGNDWFSQQVHLIGIEGDTQGRVSDFSMYLQHQSNRRKMSWSLHNGGYDTRDHQGGPQATERKQMKEAGWRHRRHVARYRQILAPPPLDGAPKNPFESARASAPAPGVPDQPFAKKAAVDEFDPAKQQHTGAVLGIALSSFRTPDGRELFRILPGDDIKLTLPTVGKPPTASSDDFTIVDFYESKMSEYDASFVFVPIEKLQELRGMNTGVGSVSSIQIKLKPGADGNEVRDKLREKFQAKLYGIYTWRDKQGPLLAAVQMETAILNVLLFLIIAVAGFGILAIFLMIVVEKTKDIGILKSLGASGRGVMGIFLAYGLSLGAVGSGAGMILGLLFVHNINKIADLLGKIRGEPVFSPDIYYFYKIPTIVNPFTIGWIVLGAMTIAVLASVLPALRAALLHPVEALRYE